MKNLPRLSARHALLVMPLLFLGWLLLVYGFKGPNWIMVPQDLSYNYLLNGLNVLDGEPIGTLIHPAITTIYYIAGVTWLTHLVAGSGPLNAAVISDPEFYFNIVANSVTLLMALALYAMGRMAYRGLGSLRLTMMAQFFAFIPPLSILTMNSYGSPESMFMILMMLQIGLTLATLDGGLSDQRSRWRYTWLSAVIGGAAIATKFIAAPMLILPALIIPTVRWKALFVLLAGVATLVWTSPIYLIPENWQQFSTDMGLLLQSAASERMAQGSVSILLNILSQLERVYFGYELSIYFLGTGLVVLVATVVAGPLRKAFFGTPPYRLFVISQVTIVAAFLFIFLRPKAHYLAPYTLIQGMGFALFFLMIGRHVLDKRLSGRNFRTVTWWATGGVAAVFAIVFQYNFNDPASGYPFLTGIKSDAQAMNNSAFGDKTGNTAIVTAIQASNIPTALNHANQTSHFFHWKYLNEFLPPYHFDYIYDGKTVWNHNRYSISFPELLEKYDKVLFWTTKGNFFNQEWRVAPTAVWRDVKVGMVERLAELVAFPLLPPYDERAGAEENRKRGWVSGECPSDSRCLQVRVPAPETKALTHFRFYADTADQVANMPTKWRVEGSQDGKQWQVLDEFLDTAPWVTTGPWWKERSNKTYRLKNDRIYLYYRFVSDRPDGAPSAWPGRVFAYSKGGNAPDIVLIPRNMQFLHADALAEEIVPPGFWEEPGGFPKTLVKELAAPRMATGYALSTGADGADGRDSWGRMPLTWSLQGSVDGKQWVELDRQENVPAWKSNEIRFYRLKKSGPYKYFRLIVDKAASDTIVRLYHLYILGPSQGAPAPEKAKPEKIVFYEMQGPFPLGIQFDFGHAMRTSVYQLKAGPYGIDSTERMPKMWTIEGSNDGESWKTVDYRYDESGWTNLERREYRISSPGEYRYYRLVVLQTRQDSILRISEIKFFESRLPQTKLEEVSGTPTTP